ncbi:MAG: 2-phospho-L-lactate transferase [Actinomycetota bacterium]
MRDDTAHAIVAPGKVVVPVAALAGGVGAAKFLRGLIQVVDPGEVTVIGNTGDDTVMYGLHISPDLDIVTYTLAGIVDAAGWGIAGDTTSALEQLASYGVDTWFTLKDRDIGTHMARTHWLAGGQPLHEAADRIRRGLGLGCRILPMSNNPVRTRIVTAGGTMLDFQEYFVKRRHQDEVAEVLFEGAEDARPAPGVVEALESADRIFVCPSNPVLSIGPILAVPGILETLVDRRRDVMAISPLVAGAALKGPAATLMPVVGAETSCVGVARLYTGFCATLAIDTLDAALAREVEAFGMRAVVTGTVMQEPAHAVRLASELMQL